VSTGLLFTAVAGLVLYLLHTLHRKQAHLIKQQGYHTYAIVRYYKTEYVRVAGSWDWLEYPYVEYVSKDGELILYRLKYASSRGRLLVIGEEVEVVLYDSVLYYAPALAPVSWADIPALLKKALGLLILAVIPSFFFVSL